MKLHDMDIPFKRICGKDHRPPPEIAASVLSADGCTSTADLQVPGARAETTAFLYPARVFTQSAHYLVLRPMERMPSNLLVLFYLSRASSNTPPLLLVSKWHICPAICTHFEHICNLHFEHICNAASVCIYEREQHRETALALQARLEGIGVVGTTCLQISSSFLASLHFDYCIVDEASQVGQKRALSVCPCGCHRICLGLSLSVLVPVCPCGCHRICLGLSLSVLVPVCPCPCLSLWLSLYLSWCWPDGYVCLDALHFRLLLCIWAYFNARACNHSRLSFHVLLFSTACPRLSQKVVGAFFMQQ
jgi:hypothetical protein